ncbi:MAG: uL15 family ribosomal protein [Clostridia bacterium]|nr:uL15 family ribosomal protein [Clostridia bacterium]
MMTSVFALQANAAKIEFMVKDITEPNLTVTVDDGTVYTKKIEPSVGYKLPATLLITTSDGTVLLPSQAYTYSPETGVLVIQADSVKGTLTIMGAAGELIPVETPTVTGSFVVYETLTAVVHPDNATVTYQWFRDKTPITGATAPTYTLTLADVGKEINVEITGTGDYGGQKISTTNTPISKKKTVSPSQSDVILTHNTKNGGTSGVIASNSQRALQYYDKDAAAWKALPARNKPAGEYQIRYAETSDTLPSDSIVVRIFEPCTSPVATDVTVTHLSVAGASTGKMTANTSKVLEFYNGTSWVSFPITGLKAGKYQVRFAATTDYLASEPTTFFVREPSKLVATPADVRVTHVTVHGASTGELRVVSSISDTMEAFVDGVWKTLPVTKLKAGTYQVRYAATDTTFASATCNVTVKEPSEAPKGITVKDVAVYGGNTGEISGLKTAWQLSYDGSTWHDCTQTTLSGLSAGTYHFRTKETATHLASEPVAVIVKQPEITPEATIDYVNGTLKNLVASSEYLIENVSYTSTKTGTVSIVDNNLAGKKINVIKKGNGKTTNNSAAQTLNVPARPATPDAPVILGKTDTTVHVSVKPGLEYSINGTTWITATADSYTFTKLKANTAYTVYARVKAVEDKSFTSVSAATAVTTKKSSAAAVVPKRATVTEITDTTVTIQVVNGQEYRLGDGIWIVPSGSTHTWKDLKEQTVYTIGTRTAETEDTMYSTAISTVVTTYTKLKITSFDVDYWKQAITGLVPGQYAINGGKSIEVDDDGELHVGDYFGRTVSLTRLGSTATKTVDSDPVDVAIISPVAAPTKAEFDVRKVQTGLTSLTVTEVDPRLEYQVLDQNGVPVSVWKSSSGEAIVFDGLTHSTAYRIQVCFKATDTQPKSNALISDIIYTKFYEETPAATVDTVKQLLANLVPNATYSVNGTSYIADASGHMGIEDAWVESVISLIKCGDGNKTVDSAAQTLELPGRTVLNLSPKIGQVTFHGGNNGSIGGLDSGMEISADGGSSWTAINGDTAGELTVQEYLIRRKGEAGKLFASVPQSVEVTLNTELADYKKQIVDALEQTYDDMVASKRYTDAQLAQARAILDDGIRNINSSLNSAADVDRAKETILENIAQVPCANTPTADGKLVGSDITSDQMLQYPNDGDAVWGNVSNDDGLDSTLSFVIEKLGQSATAELRAQIGKAIEQKLVNSFDGALSADEIYAALEKNELKVGLDITLCQGDTPTETFNGTYTVTLLLPLDVQGAEGLNVVSVGENGEISFHPAVVSGNYLSFETNHFSIYGIVGSDALAIAKAETLEKISDLYDSLDQKDYSRDNWNELEQAFLTAIEAVSGATSEQEVEDAWNALNDAVRNTPAKKSLSWLWILMLIVVLMIAFAVVCLLVWRVRYFDGEEKIGNEFHFWRTKVALMTGEKDGYVLEGWYYDPELTDRAENGFLMPWHGVRLYAKWNMIEILRDEEEEIPSEEEPADETEQEAEEDAPVETEEPITDDNVEDEAEEDASEDENELPADDEQLLMLEAADEDDSETDGDTTETTEEADEDEDKTPALEEPPVVPLLAEPAEEDSEEATEDENSEEPQSLVVVGDRIDDGEADEDESAEDEDSYRNTDAYHSWLLLGDSTQEEEQEEVEQLEDGDEIHLFTNEKTGEKYHIRFNLSFRAKMTSLSDEAKDFYRELKDEFLTYKGVKTRIAWKAESVRKGRETLAKFVVRENTLCIFLALDPENYRDSKYVFESVKDIKAYESIPMLVRVKSDLSCRKVKELIADMMQPREVKRLDAPVETDYSYLDEDSSAAARLKAGQLRIWADGPDDQVCANRAAAATLHYLVSPEATVEDAEAWVTEDMLNALMPQNQDILIVTDARVAEVSIEQLCKKFYVGDVVDMDSLKEKDLIPTDATYVKIIASDKMTKRLTVNAHMFERAAAKMILLTGGDVNIMTE